MKNVDYTRLCEYAKHFSRLDADKLAALHQAHPDIAPRLAEVTDTFYDCLQDIPKARPFLEGRLESLKHTHRIWVEELFTSDFGEDYTRKLYKVGDVHVKVKLPVEFMAGAMVIIQGELIRVFGELYASEHDRLVRINGAVNSATGFSLFIMQESYQSSSLAEELEKFLKITGMSRVLFDNLARAYR